jgi:hypothetical protein
MKREDIDACFAVCFTGYKDRAPRLLGELKRAGIDDVDVIWNFPTPYDNFIMSRIPVLPVIKKKPGYFSAGMGQYRAMKTAYHRGMERILIVEDDCRFLKDVDRVWDTLEKAPCDGNILMLDSFKVQRCGDTANGWAPLKVGRSTACLVMDRKAMARFIEMHESPVSGKYAHPMLRICDHWLDQKYAPGLKMYFSDPKLAIQCNTPNASNSGPQGVSIYYKNINFDDYAPY